MRWTRIFGPRLLNVAQAAYYDSPFLFGVVLPGFDLQSQAGVLGFEDPVITPVKSFPNINLSGYQGFQGSPSDQRPCQTADPLRSIVSLLFFCVVILRIE